MTVREYIEQEAERKAKMKRLTPTLTDIALAWALKVDSVNCALVEQLVLEKYDYLIDEYLQKLRECVDELGNALAWISDEQKEKGAKKHG